MDGMLAKRLAPLRQAIGSTVAALFLLGICVPPVHALDWREGEWLISWDNTITYGLSTRLKDPDPRIIGLANGGTAFSVNGDNGNLNYDTGIWSNVVKLNSEVQVDYKQFGLFVRGWGFYDWENQRNRRQRTPLTLLPRLLILAPLGTGFNDRKYKEEYHGPAQR